MAFFCFAGTTIESDTHQIITQIYRTKNESPELYSVYRDRNRMHVRCLW